MEMVKEDIFKELIKLKKNGKYIYFDFRSNKKRALIDTFETANSFIKTVIKSGEAIDSFLACDDDQYEDKDAEIFLEFLKRLGNSYYVVHARDDLCDHFVVIRRFEL